MAIRGACVFRNDGDGCLSSKYANEVSAPFVEACKLISSNNPNDPFVGTFRTVWLENTSDMPVSTELEIERQANGTYKLVWQNPRYEGIGMIYQNLLVCGYWD